MDFDSKRWKKLAGILKESGEVSLDQERIHADHDKEGKMAKRQLEQLMAQAQTLFELMPDDAELESWVQSKLTLATEMLDVVSHYLLDETPEEVEQINEAEYQGRDVELNKPMRGDVKKFKVYVKDPETGNVKKVNFGDPDMRIRKNDPERRKSFRARHNCDNPGPKTKARYWSCKKW